MSVCQEASLAGLGSLAGPCHAASASTCHHRRPAAQQQHASVLKHNRLMLQLHLRRHAFLQPEVGVPGVRRLPGCLQQSSGAARGGALLLERDQGHDFQQQLLHRPRAGRRKLVFAGWQLRWKRLSQQRRHGRVCPLVRSLPAAPTHVSWASCVPVRVLPAPAERAGHPQGR